MTLAILATGDEIVHGDTLNTNAQHIAHLLSSEGISLGLHMTCSDKKTDMVRCLQFLKEQHDIIIVIGGLGPTSDDLTRFALAEVTGLVLVENPIALLHVTTRLQAANVPMNAGNLQQCLFPKDATILPNPHGSAVGCMVQWQSTCVFLLPGPPRECMPMMHHHVLSHLNHIKHSDKQILKWRIFGLAESEIAQTLEEALADIDCQTGYRLDTPYIEFKVRCKPELIDTVHQKINPILAPHIIAPVHQKASDLLRERILELNQTVTIIDEATGGLLQTLLVKPETHAHIQFNSVKRTDLFFHLSGLDEYWEQTPKACTTQLRIQFSSQSQQGGEQHELAYRSALVTYYAVEWLSFRLLHLINQLHQ
jgi:nicotinamide-nucleotide amidase